MDGQQNLMGIMAFKDPEKAKKYYAEWRKANSEVIKKKKAEYRRLNSERLAERQRVWRSAHPDYQLRNQRKNREKYRRYCRESYQRHRARRLKADARYRKLNPHVDVKAKAKRRMRIEATIENERAVELFIKLIRTSKRVACYYCEAMVSGRRAHIDHVIPLAKGGAHAISNLCASCPACNLSKHAKLLTEWKRSGQQVLPL